MSLKRISKILVVGGIVFSPMVKADMEYLKDVKGYLTAQCSLDSSMCESVLKAFNKAVTEKSGKRFKASMIRLSTSESITRLNTELGSSKKAAQRKCKNLKGQEFENCLNKTYKTRIDVLFGGTDGPYRGALEDNIFATYNYPNTGIHPWSAKLTEDSDNRLGAFYMGILGMAYNKNVLRAQKLTPPTGWADLGKSDYKDTIGVANANTSGTSYKYLSSMLTAFGSEDAGWERIVANHKNISQYTKSGSAPCKLVARGEMPICIGFMHDIANLAHNGAPIVGVAPAEGTLFEVGPVAIVLGSQNRKNAEAFAKFLYEPATQAALEEGGGRQFHVNVASKVPAGAPDIASVKLLDAPAKFGTKSFKKSVIDKWNTDIFPMKR